jgi:acyl carrier protein
MDMLPVVFKSHAAKRSRISANHSELPPVMHWPIPIGFLQPPELFARFEPIGSVTEFVVSESLTATVPSAPTPATVQQDPLALERDLAGLFVQALNLDTKAEDIDPLAPLFGDGLGLDSIDVLEVALEVSHRYGFQLRSDDDNNQKIFQNLRSLAAHIALHRKQ